MASSVFAKGNTALISGGASGVGLSVAKLCRKHGMKVLIIDHNAENLKRAKDSLGPEDTETHEMDVSKLDQWRRLCEDISKKTSRIDFMLLNAGLSTKASWDDSEYFEKVLNTNLFGIVYGINTFLPLIRAQPSDRNSAIVLTGSKQGITNPPGNPAYNASKAAVKSLAEQLSYEMRDSNTAVHLLVPGWTFTGLSGGGPVPTKEKPDGAWDPDQVAEYLKKKMDEHQFWVICPDNDVNEDKDKRRMLWSGGDVVFGRKPLSRWRDEYKDEAEKTMAGYNV